MAGPPLVVNGAPLMCRRRTTPSTLVVTPSPTAGNRSAACGGDRHETRRERADLRNVQQPCEPVRAGRDHAPLRGSHARAVRARYRQPVGPGRYGSWHQRDDAINHYTKDFVADPGTCTLDDSDIGSLWVGDKARSDVAYRFKAASVYRDLPLSYSAHAHTRAGLGGSPRRGNTPRPPGQLRVVSDSTTSGTTQPSAHQVPAEACKSAYSVGPRMRASSSEEFRYFEAGHRMGDPRRSQDLPNVLQRSRADSAKPRQSCWPVCPPRGFDARTVVLRIIQRGAADAR